MSDYPKPIRRLLREYMGQAYEKELFRELTKLDQSFAEWREGKIDSGELSHRLHQYEVGPARELYKLYSDTPPDLAVAYAITAGILNRGEMPIELLEAIKRPLDFYQSLKDQGELREPGKPD
jgi:hypothetical protein